MIQQAIETLVSGESLSQEEAARAMDEIMVGEATPAQLGTFVTALRMKGETPDEIAGMARTMREKSLHVSVDGPLADTCGTGGDASGTFNISTTAGFVLAGAGVKVAKHGNRAMSGACGSADVLEALGVKIDLGPTASRGAWRTWASASCSPRCFTPPCASPLGPGERSASGPSSTSWVP